METLKKATQKGARRVAAVLMAVVLAAGSLAAAPTAAYAETWAQYLARQWQACEDTFAALDRDTGLAPWDGTSSQPGRGSGTADDPWLVGTPAELSWVMHSAPATQKSLRLTADLDMGGQGRRQWAPATGFDSGTVLIDGNGHTVYNLYVAGTSTSSATGPGLAFIASVNNPSFTMCDITFRYAEVRSGGGYNQAVAVGYFARGLVDNVGVEDSLVTGGDFVAGLLVGWSTGFSAVDGSGNKLAAPTGSFINNCRTVRVYTHGASCIGNFTAPLMGGTVTNSYAVDGVTISTGGHSGGFVSCPGYCYVENCFCNITMYGNTQTGVFNGVNHYNNAFVNCGASGVVEGTSQVGGFVGDATGGTSSATPSQYTNCYSTTMTGMQSSASNMGGFVGSADGNIRFAQCFAAGEVGALTTDGNDATVGGFVGANGGASYTACFFDMQTTAMDMRTAEPAGVTGLLTKEMTGSGALANLPGFSGDLWLAKDGVYPQLKRFNDPQEFAEADRNTMTAYSMASVCTAMLYPSNGDFEDTAHDSVRKITYVFPFTNDAMVGDPAYAVSWTADEIYSSVVGDNDIPVIVLDDKTYEVKSLAPGVGWTTVEVVYTAPDGTQATGTRRMRLVPTTTLSLATSRGIDHVAYVAREGARPLPVNTDEGFVSYDHRLGVNFSTGSAVDLGTGTLKQEPFPADSEDFADVQLSVVGGVVDVAMERQDDEGNWVEVELTDSVKELLLRQRHTELADLGHYRMIYKWYTSGNKKGAYLESIKYLDVLETFDVTYYKNDADLEQPKAKADGTVAPVFWRASTSGLWQATARADGGSYSYDIGAYLPGDTVDDAYYPGSASKAEGVPDAPTTDGWRFDGWNTAADGSGAAFDENTELKGSVKLYAQWSPKPVKVVFDLDGGAMPDPDDPDAPADASPIVQDKHALDTVTPPAGTPVRDGYSFMGWSTEKGSLKADFDPDEQLWEEPDGERTYYAVWVPNPTTSITAETRNTTDPEAAHPQVGDDLETTVVVSNTGDPDSYWKGVDVEVPLPVGVDLSDDPIEVRYPDGTVKTYDPKELFDPETRTVKVPVGDVPGDSKVTVELHTTVNGKVLDPPNDPDAVPPVTIPVQASGTNPDGSPVPAEVEETLPKGGDQVLPDDPEPTVTKAVTDLTRGDAVDAQVGDVLRYTVTVTNDVPDSLLKNARATDLLPAGIDLDRSSVRVTYADGTTGSLDSADVYDEDTHTLTVPVGDIPGGSSAIVVFEGSIARSAVDDATPGAHDVGNVATVDGDTPEDREVPTESSDKVFPAGWIKFAVPQPSLSKTVADDDSDGGFYEGDQVTYTIEVGNAMVGTVWEDVTVHDVLPDGLSLVTTSLWLEHPDGSRERLPHALYDPETRELTVPVGDVAGGEVWRVTYACDLSVPADGGEVVNKASATGSGFGPKDPDAQGGPQAGGTVAIEAGGSARIEAVRPEAELPGTGGTTTSRTERTVRRVLRGLAVLPVTGDRTVDGAVTLGACVTVAVAATVAVAVRRRTT